MKKTFILFILSIPFILLAQSPEKLVSEGQYDEAINKCVDRLSRDRGDETKLYAALKQAYETANTLDLDRISELKKSGKPDIWYDVYKLYKKVNNRYVEVSKIKDKLVSDKVNIKLISYPQDMEVARNNAGAYLYAHATHFLQSGDPTDAYKAYIELLKLSRMFDEYKDVEKLMREALGGFGAIAFVDIRNNSDAALSPDFLSKMKDIPLTIKEKGFLDIRSKKIPGEEWPLILMIEIDKVKVSPGTVSEREYTASLKEPEKADSVYSDEKKKLEDKVHPDYNKCKIKEIYQIKTGMMKGRLKYIDASSSKVLYIVPISAQAKFENRTATASGDMYACPPEVKEVLDKPKKKFPKNADMLYEVANEFKLLVKSTVWDDSFIKN